MNFTAGGLYAVHATRDVMSDEPWMLAIQDQRLIVDYSYIAGAAILIYDFILTFHSEISLVWFHNSKFSYTTVLFLISRYLPMIDMGFLIYGQTGRDLNQGTCERLYPLITWLLTIGILVGACMFVLRTWAVWGRGRNMGIFLGLMMIALTIISLYGDYRSIEETTLGPSPYPGFRGCNITNISGALSWVFVVTSEALIVMMSLVCFSACKAYQIGNSSKLSAIIHRDAIQVYFVLLAIAIISAVLILDNVRPSLWPVMYSLQSAFYSVMSCRVIINIRSANGLKPNGGNLHDDCNDDEEEPESALAFAKNPYMNSEEPPMAFKTRISYA